MSLKPWPLQMHILLSQVTERYDDLSFPLSFVIGVYHESTSILKLIGYSGFLAE